MQIAVFSQAVCVVRNLKVFNCCLCLIFASCALNLTANGTSYAAGETIIWGEMDLPPLSYVSGPLKGQGMLNRQLDQILASLPNYKHARIPVSIRRLIVEMSAGNRFCFQALTKNKVREQFIDFVTPTMLTLPFGLLTTDKNKEKLKPFLNQAGEIDLDAVLESGTLTLADYKGRSYSIGIDATLERHRHREKSVIHINSGVPDWSLTVKQILHNRVDTVIGKPGEVILAAKETSLPNALIYIPIQGEEKYSLLYAGCAKGDWNTAYVRDLKEAIIKARNTPEFNKAQLDLIPKSLQPIYHEYRNAAFPAEYAATKPR